ncbi:MAG: hypothetical protein IJT36_02030 [Alphaproteobacteria bacterium]|nr:hypothetical protein [Alphaproteobacteria bacterium]
MKKLTAFVLLFFCVCGCQPKINSRGNITLAEKIDTFTVGKTKTTDVYNACGTPSLQKGENIWIYMGARSEEIAFRNVEMADKLTVRLTFDNKGILQKIERLSPDNNYGEKKDTDTEEVTELIKK